MACGCGKKKASAAAQAARARASATGAKPVKATASNGSVGYFDSEGAAVDFLARNGGGTHKWVTK